MYLSHIDIPPPSINISSSGKDLEKKKKESDHSLVTPLGKEEIFLHPPRFFPTGLIIKWS